ncbi:MAG: glycosyltransferase [Azospirillum sp.]|nr:glycosyltransferase [Azospirillum sp.]
MVVNYNSGVWLRSCLRALSRQSVSDFEAVVVDNASTDGSIDDAVPEDPRFAVIALPRNIGFAAANNHAAAGAECPFLATLNPDAEPEPDWLAALLAAADRYPAALAFGSTQVDAGDDSRLDGAGDVYFALGLAWRGLYRQPRSLTPPTGAVFSPCAAAALYRRSAFAAAGGFDERYFCYMEDVDLGFRLRLAGGLCVQVREAVVRHAGSACSGRYSDFTVYHSSRNRIWLFCKNMPQPLFAALLPGHLLLNLLLLVRAWCHGEGRPTWRGQLDGLRGLPALWIERRRVQSRRIAGWREIARGLTWSPLRVLRRSAAVAPLDARPAAAGPRRHEVLH